MKTLIKKKPKYKNKKTVRIVNGEPVLFDSLKEARHFDTLYALARAGKITNLILQPKFLILDGLKVDGHRKLSDKYYNADFKHTDDKGQIIITDVKGMKTPVYNLKKHLFLQKYGHKYIFKEV